MPDIDPFIVSTLLALADQIRGASIPRLLTAAQAAEALNVDPKTFRRIARDDRLPYVVIGDGVRRRYTAEDLKAYIEARRVEPAMPTVNRTIVGHRGNEPGKSISFTALSKQLAAAKAEEKERRKAASAPRKRKPT